ncbi:MULTISPECIES: SusC/RagA family TonB-linked outer membrane protein [Dyadobacter]|uniref:SusC/RagA family TonB-linked outer membrane protein n=1 Tax=Dyadobacter chenhuakuii TaxID=2909339 RepID=A0A9X1TTV8_9BACT|nr:MULTISPECIES: SusC/RagA family TonB-linked outer membrane protein [Dyadobacter]MCE7071274.1 SusC/RagA family TonB-linked outer membrane protein [Dyadobacter sp. CY327]MCF2493842.1 SusC/RagA family TonB-linked outer membrane protein [Dyadobacter chenhuakuii]MCF2500649.1 SusC/RagA family TonB-linked outer membrane protein [Dyadobacter chenhuakuii]MCF2518087.1 SusC/RagA family TonB-linked outer membrane protein [Dyadobacter sp. CY351]USJ30974.1 SusC/RagA family TonB-linked outer membrane prote
MRKVLLLLLWASLTAPLAYAQVRQISGKITAADDGLGLAGASIIFKGTNVGSNADADGKFSFSVPGDGILVVSYVGFLIKELPIGNQTQFDIKLDADTRQLAEVVVTAFGIEREKKALGYTVQEVKGSSLTESRSTNVANALSGKIAGVRVQSNGGPGSSSTIQIRGSSSVSGNNQPLIVIDGVPMEQTANKTLGGGISEVNPDNIKEMSVLKGPNAAALYGSRAANGVILITTKNGQGTKGLGVEVNSNITFERPWIKPDFQNTYGGGSGYRTWYNDGWSSSITDPAQIAQYRAVYDARYPLAGSEGTDESWGAPMDGRMVRQWWTGDDVAPLTPQPNNWEEYWQTGRTITNSVALSGGNDKGYFRLGLSRVDQKGIMYYNDFHRNNFRINSGYNLTKNISVTLSGEYIKSGSDNRSYAAGQEFIWSHRSVSWDQLRNYEQYADVHNQKAGDTDPANWQHTFFTNPYFSQLKMPSGNEKDRLLGNIALNYKILPSLSLMLRSGTDYWSDTRINVTNFLRVRNGTRTPGRFNEEVLRSQETNTDFMLTYNKNITSDFGVNVQLGGIQRKNYYKRNYFAVGEMVVDGLYNAGNSVPSANTIESKIEESETQSLFGTANFSWRDGLFLDLTARNDWSSTLPSNARSYFYPSASLSAVVTELFDVKSNVLSFGKIRASYAQVGNDALPYQLAQTFTASGSWNGAVPKFAENIQIANANLKPEITTGLELGADLRFFKGKVGLDVTYYDQTTKDQILGVEISKASGYDKRILNAGKITNKGVEVTLSGTPVKLSNGFSWEVSLNYARNRNKVVELAEGLTTYTLATQRGMTSEARVGESYGTFYGVGFQKSPDGQTVYGANGLPVTASNQKLGNVQPDWIGGMLNTFNYKGFSLSALVDVRIGGDIYDEGTGTARWTGQYAETALGREEGVIGKGVREVTGADGSKSYIPNDIIVTANQLYGYSNPRNYHESAIFDASYVKLREVSLGYSISPSFLKRIKIQSAKLSVVGRNVWMIFKNTPHIDPEIDAKGANGQGFGYGELPSSRSVGMNLSLSF